MTKHIAFLLLLTSLSTAAQVFEDITSSLDLSEFETATHFGGGVSAEDYDGDGDLDIAIPSHRSYSARILTNENEGGFTEQFFPLDFHSRAALWIDYNGDHLLDLFFAGDSMGIDDQVDITWALFKQESNGDFVDVTVEAGLASPPDFRTQALGGIAAGDLDSNGYMDIVISNFRGPSLILKNSGQGVFEIELDPFDLGNQQNWQPIIYDLNRDGFEDIYQAVDFNVPNQFWTHNGDGIFEDLANNYGLGHACNDMGITLGDYDVDGDLDLYISCIELYSLETGEVRGNQILRNDSFSFTENGLLAGVAEGGWGWGVTFIDGDMDGFPDLAATNGMQQKDQSKYWHNLGNASFEDISHEVNFRDSLMATSLISLDFDRDGDLDLLQTFKASSPGYALAFLQNTSNLTDQNYVVVKPRMSGTNHWAIGALVRIKTSEGIQIRPITAGISFYGQEPAEAYFGLGNESSIQEIEVIWPGGALTKIKDVQANQVIIIEDTDALHPPLNLKIVSSDENSITLGWDQVVSVATGLVLERSSDGTFNTVDAFNLGAEEVNFTDTELDPLQQYFYRLRAFRDEEITRNSISVSAFTAGIQINKPSDLQYELLSETEVSLSWNDLANNEDGYYLQRSGSSEFNNFLQFTLPEDANDYLDDNLEPGGAYFYRVQAFSENGASDYSNVIMVQSESLIILGLDSKNTLEIYPNPTNSSFAIDSYFTIRRVSLRDLSGRIIFSEKMDCKYFESLFLPKPGAYLVEITLENEEKIFRKLIVD